jgi:uncharacterized membrane protein YkvA (DUF1232 family)
MSKNKLKKILIVVGIIYILVRPDIIPDDSGWLGMLDDLIFVVVLGIIYRFKK